MKARYVGKIGNDSSGVLQQNEMRKDGIEAHWIIAPNCQSQSSFILVDEDSGERTVLWKRDDRLALAPTDLCQDWILNARALHLDGHDTAAATVAVKSAPEMWCEHEQVTSTPPGRSIFSARRFSSL